MCVQEFEIELEGSQTLRLLCYEKCYNKTKLNKEDGESTDRIMGKGQIPVCTVAMATMHQHSIYAVLSIDIYGGQTREQLEILLVR